MLDFPAFDGSQACGQPTPAAARAFAGALGADPSPAQRLCGSCRFTVVCREYALTHDVTGVWGGTTDADRDLIRAERQLPDPPRIGDQLDDMVLALREARHQRLGRVS